MGIGSKLAFGAMSERFTARRCCVASVALQTGGLVIMALAASVPAMWCGIFVFGLGFGGLGALLVLIVQEEFGMKEFGSIQGVVQVAMTGSMAAAPPSSLRRSSACWQPGAAARERRRASRAATLEILRFAGCPAPHPTLV